MLLLTLLESGLCPSNCIALHPLWSPVCLSHKISLGTFKASLYFTAVWASLVAQQIKNLPTMQETLGMQVQSLSWEDPLEEEMETHSNILA